MEIKILKRIGIFGAIIGSVGVFSMVLQGATAEENRYATIQEVRDMIGDQKLQSSQMLQLYPVGSIYMSVSATNPSSLFGGTWVAWGSGRVPVGVNTSDGNFNAVEKTGGTASETLSAAQMPSHSHTFTGNAVASSGNSVTPTASFTGTAVSSGNNSVTPTVTFAGGTVNTGNNSVGHTHSIPALSGKTSASGTHSHIPTQGGFFYVTRGDATSDIIPGIAAGPFFGGNNGPDGIRRASGLDASGSHDHTLTTTASTTGGISSNHTHSMTSAGSVSLASTTHTHAFTASGSVSLANTNHTHSMTAAGSNSSTGGGGSHNNLQPYITSYMWKRTS